MSKELDSEMELYGVSPNAIVVIMIFITFFLPVGGANLIPYGGVHGFSFIFSALWMILPSAGLSSLWLMMNPLIWVATIWLTIPLCSLNLLYIRQLWRHYMGYCNKGSVLWIGLLSLMVPSIISLYVTYLGFPVGLVLPIPIQFICGLVFLYKFREPELISAWAGIYLDLSWWSIQAKEVKHASTKLPSLSKLLEDHEADWLEGW